MAERGEVVIQMSFGPSSSRLVPRAVAYAKAHAGQVLQIEPRVWQVSFRLGDKERTYGQALSLYMMIWGWKSTLAEVDHSPEHPQVVLLMLLCSRHYLRTVGRCAEHFSDPSGYPKCRTCPLYDPEWAAESGQGSSFVPPAFDLQGDQVSFHIPDHLPDEWEQEGDEGP